MKSADWNTNDQILQELQVILDTENPCDIKINAGTASCRAGTPCCRNCQSLTQNGCPSVPPACKFYFCLPAWDRLSEVSQVRIKELGANFVGDLRNRGNQHKLKTRPPYIW